MELIRGLHNLAPRHRGSVVSIGNFDGLHRGHQALIARLRVLAAEQGLPATVVSFEPMPREYFQRDNPPPRIAGLRGKLRDLEAFGVERVLLLPFGPRLAAMTAEAFVHQVLVDGLGARAVIVGDDFRYGAKRAGDLALLQAIGAAAGFSAEGLGTVTLDGERSSSTALRAALAHGVYAVKAYWDDQPQGLPGVASLGVRPTLGLTTCLLETHVFDARPDLYGRELAIEFHQFLRPQLTFDGLDALAAQMQADGRDARTHFTAEPMPS